MKNAIHTPKKLLLHPAQEELRPYFSIQPQGGNSIVGGCLTLVGQLNYGALRRVVDHLPVMFDVFRWQVDPADPQPDVRVAEPFRVPALPLIDCSDDANPRQAADAEIRERIGYPFASQTFFDFTLLRVFDTEHRLLIRGHRLLLDDAGFDRMVRYLAEAYSSVVATGTLPEPAPMYAEDGVSARLYDNSLDYSEGQTHWHRQFSETPAPLLTQRRPAEAGQPFYRLMGSDPFCRALEQAAAGLGEPPAFLLLAALTVYFARLNGQSVCVFGRSVPGRQSKRQQATVGRFDRALPIRLSYQPAQSLRLLVRSIRRQHRADNSHRHFPMSRLAKSLAMPGQPTPALFDVFVKQLPAAPAAMFGEVSCRVERLPDTEPTVPLQFIWQDGNAYQPACLQVLGQSAFISQLELRWLLVQAEQLLTDFARRPDAAVGSFDVALKPTRSAVATAYTPFRLSSRTGCSAGF